MLFRSKMRLEFSSLHGITRRPAVDENHQSTVPGLYVVGDLSHASTIASSVSQGEAAARHIASTLETGPPVDHDVLIIGAGPAGIGAAMVLAQEQVDYVVIEKDRVFSTLHHFPTGKMLYPSAAGTSEGHILALTEGTKEDVVTGWEQALRRAELNILLKTEAVASDLTPFGFNVHLKVDGEAQVMRVKRIILATGKRSAYAPLGVPGEDLDHVHRTLEDPSAFSGQRVTVIGGGDTAVESAIALASAGAAVTLAYRGHRLHRIRPRNREAIDPLVATGAIDLRLRAQVLRLTPQSVVLKDGSSQQAEVPVDHVFCMIGTQVPMGFLRRMGIRFQGDLTRGDALWLACFSALVYAFYCLKGGHPYFPFGEGQPLYPLHEWLEVDLGFREVGAAFWGSFTYGVVMTVLGLRAMARYPSRTQRRRYWSLIGFQWIFLFGVPEVLAPLVIERPWKLYALAIPWPLSIWSLIDGPQWVDGDTVTAASWVGLGAFVSFVAIPLYVRRQGQRFCSYLCGCGGLAETLGDAWRHLAPRGRDAKNAEVFGRVVFALAVPVTLLILNDAWAFIENDALYTTKAFAQHWYSLVVDFWLASIIGIALYPYLGNRVWCRFFCPLRAYMEELSRRFSRLSIRANDQCISCGECTVACQMGIPVQGFAQRQVDLNNTNSACIQCGICIEVCPMDVLNIGASNQPVTVGSAFLRPPRAPWAQS